VSACSGDGTHEALSGRGINTSYENCKALLAQYNVEFVSVKNSTHGQCKIQDAVEVSRFGQAKLSTPAVMTCALAMRMSELEAVYIQPAAQRILGSPIKTIHHYGSYACRKARGKSRLSQHAYANALDIGIFETQSGVKASVSRHWKNAGKRTEFLKTVGQGACTLFHGVLGPDSDSNHRDHFHFDLGPYTYCQQRFLDPRDW